MRILVNATTCTVGGGVQVAVSFISKALSEKRDLTFRFAVSPQVLNNLPLLLQQDERILVLSPSPANLWSGRATRDALHALEAQFQPDVVFTVFGPAYVRFRTPHVCGIGDGWVTHRSKIALSVLPFLHRLRCQAICKYKELRLSTKDYYWVEAEAARSGLLRLLGLEPSRVKLISNCYADFFATAAKETAPYKKNDGVTRIFCLAAPYPHKNLTIIPEVARLLQERNSALTYRFIVTLPDSGREVRKFWARANSLGVTSMIENAGYLPVQECPRWYASSDITFLPTLLETFSVTYLESMVMNRPIVTTDLDFARDICGAAALYYSPLSAEEAATAIESVATNRKLYDALKQHGCARIKQYPTPEEKYETTLRWICEVGSRNA